MADNSSQIVYVLTNPAMPGLVKIGKTTQLEVSERMKQLYSTGVPVPFDCAFACQVKDASEVEKALHFAFGRDRTNPNREFFSIEADVEAVDKQSAQHLKEARRPRMNFQELNIPAGSILVFKDGQAQVTVLDERKVNLNGVICSLTAATRKVLGLADNYPLQPSPYWTFNGKTVKEIYETYHSTVEDA